MPGSPIILLVEDNEIDSFVMRAALAKAGIAHSLRVVPDGEDAVRYLAGVGAYDDRNNHPLPRLILLDLNLPRMGGLDVLQWIANQPEPVPYEVVVVSASNAPEDVVRAYDLGARSFLVKPNNPEELVELLAPLEGYLNTPIGRFSLLSRSLAQPQFERSRATATA